MLILAVVGITLTGEQEVLGFSVGDRENQVAWEALLDDLKERCVKEIELWVSDGNQTMLNASDSKFPSSSRQRCVVHKMENVLSYVPNKQREYIEPELKALFYHKNREAADQAVAAFIEKYQKSYLTAIACLQRDLDACLTFYSFPKEHWKTIRTNNIIERLFGEVKRRSHKMASVFRNEDSRVLLFFSHNFSLLLRIKLLAETFFSSTNNLTNTWFLGCTSKILREKIVYICGSFPCGPSFQTFCYPSPTQIPVLISRSSNLGCTLRRQAATQTLSRKTSRAQPANALAGDQLRLKRSSD